MKEIGGYPLAWPPGFPRSKHREYGRFKTNYDNSLRNVQQSLRGFAADSGKKLEHAIMSSNMTLTIATPQDPGVAVWFVWDGLQLCIAVDRYDTPAKNLQAIHHILEARRVELRHGTLALVRASFAGFKALPPPPGCSWREVLGIAPDRNITRDEVEAAWKRKAGEHHPDRGGDLYKMQAINEARDTALREIG
jgi:hypothetical protein